MLHTCVIVSSESESPTLPQRPSYPNGPPPILDVSQNELDAFFCHPNVILSPQQAVSISTVKLEDTTEQLLACYHGESALMAVNSNNFSIPPISISMGDFTLWLLDSGATGHFTMGFRDLIDPF